MVAFFRFEVLVITEINERVEIINGFKNNITASAPIAAIRAFINFIQQPPEDAYKRSISLWVLYNRQVYPD